MKKLIGFGILLSAGLMLVAGCSSVGEASLITGYAMPMSFQRLVKPKGHQLVKIYVEESAYVQQGALLVMWQKRSGTSLAESRRALARANRELTNALNVTPLIKSKGKSGDWRYDAWKVMYDERYIGLEEFEAHKPLKTTDVLQTPGLTAAQKRRISRARAAVENARRRVKAAQSGSLLKWYAPIDGVVMPGGMLDQTQDPLGVMSSAQDIVIAEDNLVPVFDISDEHSFKDGQPILVSQSTDGTFIEGEIFRIERGIVSRETGKLGDRVFVTAQFPGYLISGQPLYFKQKFMVGWWDNMKRNMANLMFWKKDKSKGARGVREQKGDLSRPPTGDAAIRTQMKYTEGEGIEGLGVDPEEILER